MRSLEPVARAKVRVQNRNLLMALLGVVALLVALSVITVLAKR